MKEIKGGPFKRKAPQKKKTISILSSWKGIALSLILISQVPISLKATLELSCLVNNQKDSILIPSWCKTLSN